MAKTTVKVYTTAVCPWCVKAKDFLKAHKVKFEEFNVTTDEKARKDMIDKSGQMGVPVIEISKSGGEDTIIVGFDQEALEEALKI
jgi:glutaredoxin-like YruB-family protein